MLEGMRRYGYSPLCDCKFVSATAVVVSKAREARVEAPLISEGITSQPLSRPRSLRSASMRVPTQKPTHQQRVESQECVPRHMSAEDADHWGPPVAQGTFAGPRPRYFYTVLLSVVLSSKLQMSWNPA